MVETLDCSECCQLTQEAFISLARTPITLSRLHQLSVPTDLTLPNAVFETLATSRCFPLLQCVDNIQPGSSVCDPLRCQVSAVTIRLSNHVMYLILYHCMMSSAAEALKKWDGERSFRGGIWNLRSFVGPLRGVASRKLLKICKSVQFGAFWAHQVVNSGTENRRFSVPF